MIPHNELSNSRKSPSSPRKLPPQTGLTHANGSPASLRNPIFVANKDNPIHRWVNWIAGFSGNFAGDAIDRFIPLEHRCDSTLVLDPFAGVGTTLIEAQRRGISSFGFEINPFPYLAAKAKLETAAVNLLSFRSQIEDYIDALEPIEQVIDRDGVDKVASPRRTAPPGFHSRIPFFSPLIERKILWSLDYIDALAAGPVADLFRLAFATTMVSLSNYSYEPSLSSRPGSGKPLQENAPVVRTIARKLVQMANDIDTYVRELSQVGSLPRFTVCLESFFDGAVQLPDRSVDLVVTSPPYLNNYHYVRNTRPHLYWLGYVSQPRDLWKYELGNFGKFWQTVREAEPIHLTFELPELSEKIEDLRQLNAHKGIYGGNGWANYAATYFNDSHRFLGQLGRLLKHDGVAVIVVGNNVLQGIEFRVDDELVRIAQTLGMDSETEIVRSQRVGSSIMGTGLRQKVVRPIELYEAAVIVRAPGILNR